MTAMMMTTVTDPTPPTPGLTPAAANAFGDAPAFVLPPGGVDIADVERSLVGQALERCHGNQTRAARLLRMTRYALRYRMKKFALDGCNRPRSARPIPLDDT